MLRFLRIFSFVLSIVYLFAPVSGTVSNSNESITSAINDNRPGNIEEESRRLSITTDYSTNEYIRTYNGYIPEVTCPAGYYRPQGSTKLHRISGQREDGCIPCPRGRYGSSAGAMSAMCTAPCPTGRYGIFYGATSSNDCVFCPAGKFGKTTGLISAECSGSCPAGKYNYAVGSKSDSDCITCPPGYMTSQCKWAVQPRTGRDQDHQHREKFGLPDGFVDPLPQGA